MKEFDAATKVTKTSDTAYDAQIPKDWNIGYVPLGGMAVSICMNAISQSVPPSTPDPIIATANFLKPARKDTPCKIKVEILKTGRLYTTAIGRMYQEDDKNPNDWVLILHVVSTFGDFDKEKGMTIPNAPPPIPSVGSLGPDKIYPMDLPWAQHGIGKYIKQRYPPTTPSVPERKQWLSFTDGRKPDLLSLTMFADAFTPTLMNLKREYPEMEQSYFPTMELNIHYRGRPKGDWIALVSRSRRVVNGRFETDVDIYDEEGSLVGMSRYTFSLKLFMVLPKQSQLNILFNNIV
ncbi:hypothetical protein HDU97_007775 [Phlyctochytrium planicorne]|nr:hypothetical protein HDU97_007775 [Phlyctochytrium planicorne]